MATSPVKPQIPVQISPTPDAPLIIHVRLQRTAFVLEVVLNLPPQGCTAVFGPSGSGKTSLLRAIAGLEHCARGTLRSGSSLWQNQHGVFVPTHKRAIGYVFQDARLFAHLNVHKNLLFGLKRAPKTAQPALHQELQKLITILDLQPLLQRNPYTLSGGQVQRVALARALSIAPQLLLLDEPLAALDSVRKMEFLRYLQAVRALHPIPMIWVGHDILDIACISDHVVLLDQGKVLQQGSLRTLLHNPVNAHAAHLLGIEHLRDRASTLQQLLPG